jgi:hypothetical protein
MAKTSKNLVERFGSLYWPIYITMLSATVIATFYSSIVMAEQHSHHMATSSSPTCSSTGASVKVTLSDAGFSSKSITTHHCDVLEVRNTSSKTADLALGHHDHHLAYPGFIESRLAPDSKESITLYESGEFTMHDHFNDDHETTLTIK